MRRPYLLFLGAATDPSDAKTAFGLRDWCRDDVAGQHRLPGCAVDLGLPELDPAAAAEAGVGSMLIGVAPVGGRVEEAWIAPLVSALRCGLDLVSGLHQRLEEVPEIAEAAKETGRDLHNVRHATRSFPVGTGRKRPGKRLLTVGTDCALGKKYTALAIAAELKRRGVDADFRATGQTGLMIAGRGVAIDAVVADFIAGAAEWLSPAADPDHWDVIEGQGSLHSPAYAGVSLGLLHGSQPDALVVCHDPGREHMVDLPHVPMPGVNEAAELAVMLAKRTNPAARVVGVSVNTSGLAEGRRGPVLAALRQETKLPVVDPMVEGVAELCDALSVPHHAAAGAA
ncbi:DUF1611 domain-containing protein [Phycisphaera mikurensis]|uniref:EBNA-1 nuclear protein n=1 Tax=Phycisphaera mikurensis (strain NBRC 102666 / KCTC 22515 / FYK2301M01) TaxID=1142394 RepID=I0ICV0_PHYMF|nr:DUF1611 domain-containing protein [Phycisphaera mikurensis]MBB6443295.1 putative NAD-dependent epimerase/dehydratase family protein [Phycisphaera mikurensis]BAM03088.1 hypothetical protein PSMK_09290 [Phycisphaera mikurensis NBRC 102666]